MTHAVTSLSTRDRILESAVALFSEHGFGSTSVKAIAKHAGVSQGLMYTYFASKDELLRAIFKLGMTTVVQSLELRSRDPIEALAELMRNSFALVAEHEALWRLIYSLRAQSGTLERLSVELPVWRSEIEGRLLEICQRANLAKPDLEAKILFAFIDGANQHKTLFMSDYPVDAVIDTMMEKYR